MPFSQIRQLGSGSFGEVYLERDHALERLCATKYVPKTLGAQYDEARVMLAGSNENVVRIYSADDDGAGGVVIRMEYYAQGSLADIYKGQPVEVDQAVRFIEQACRGLEHLHNIGILHRDIKPGNILLSDDNIAMLSDFGLAVTTTNVAVGPAAGYMAHLPPESLTGGRFISDQLGDVFAMGVTLYRLLEGDATLDDLRTRGVDVRQEIVAGRFPPKTFSPHIHDKLRRVLRKATHADPAKRYASAADMRHALEAARPLVSWRLNGIRPDLAFWHGLDTANGTQYEARLERSRGGLWSFAVDKVLAGRQARRQHGISQDGMTKKDALKHAGKVLSKIAQAGRVDTSRRQSPHTTRRF